VLGLVGCSVLKSFWFLVFGSTPSKSSNLIRPAGTFSKEKEIGIFALWGGLEGYVG